MCKALNDRVRHPLMDSAGKSAKVFKFGYEKCYLLVRERGAIAGAKH